MLSIDCLLKNTEYYDGIKQAMEFIAWDRIDRNRTASFDDVYNELRKAGGEVDIETAGHLYNDIFPNAVDERFSHPDDVAASANADFNANVDNLLRTSTATGEKQIGRLSPAHAIVNAWVKAFSAQLTPDQRTTSVLREIQDIVFKTFQRLDEKEGVGQKAEDTRTFAEIAQEGLDRMQKGYRDQLTGAIRGIDEVHKEAKKELNRYLAEMEKNGASPADIERFKNRFNSFMASSSHVALTSDEANKVVMGALHKMGFAKTNKDGELITDWNKLAGSGLDVHDLRENVIAALKSEGFDDFVSGRIADSFQKELYRVKGQIDQKKIQLLRSAEKKVDQIKNLPKSEFERLAELNSYGIFESGHEKLIQKISGIDAKDSEDITRLEEISHTVGALLKESGGNKMQYSTLYNHAEKQIVKIFKKNKNNKSTLLKLAQHFEDFTKLQNLGLITNPLNVVENNFSGFLANMNANMAVFKRMGLKGLKMDNELWRNTWMDVALGQPPFGHVGDKFAHSIDILDDYHKIQFSANPLDVKQNIKSLATMGAIFARGMSAGSDAAFKSVNTKKLTMTILHTAMTQAEYARIDEAVKNGKISKAEGNEQRKQARNEATDLLLESMYGQKKQKTNQDAARIVEKFGDKFNIDKSEKSRHRLIVRLANDMAVASLNLDQIVTPEMVEAAQTSAFHAAGTSLGHEANNIFSKTLKAGRQAQAKNREELIKQGKYDSAAANHFVQTIMFDRMFKMMGGALNWGLLRGEYLGFGLLTGGWGGKFKKTLDFESKESLQESMQERLIAQQRINRAFIGLALGSVGVSIMAYYGANRKKDEDEKEDEGNITSAAHGIEKDWLMRKSMGKWVPDVANLAYLIGLSKGEGARKAAAGSIDMTMNLLNANPEFSDAAVWTKIKKELSRDPDKSKAYQKGWEESKGAIARYIGSSADLPFYKSAHRFYDVGNYFATGTPIESKFNTPMGSVMGTLGGGLIEDLGLLDNSMPSLVLPGTNDAKFEQLKSMGYNSIKDIKDAYKENPYGTEENLSRVFGNGKAYKRALHSLHAGYGVDIPAEDYVGWNKE